MTFETPSDRSTILFFMLKSVRVLILLTILSIARKDKVLI